MQNTYAPTVNPGDTRTRCYRLRINNPNGSLPDAIIYEEDVVRLSDGERHLSGRGAFTVAVDMQEQVELLNPLTDQPLGVSMSAGEIQAAIYSWVRLQQKKRDAAYLPPTPAQNLDAASSLPTPAQNPEGGPI
jgi:hypothetical protein